MLSSIIDSIGNTPLVEIQKLNPVPGVKIFAKLEYMNPGGSIKDRAALYMINQAEASGELTPEKTVIEATSGNTGIGLAMICAVKGYKIALAMAENASEERKRILKARGAKLILTPRHLGSDGAIEEVYRMARAHPERYFLTDQYNNDANWKAHYHTTGPEIFEQTGGRLDSVVATVGTSGTLMGLSRYLKEQDPNIRIVCAEPYLGHGIQGLKNMKESYTPEIFDKSILDASVHIDDDTAFETARQLARTEGLFVGMSSGAAMAVAIEEARRIQKGVVVTIFPDSGERYLSTSLFSVKKNIHLNLYNSLSHQKEPFEPEQDDGDIGIYTCGPTIHRRLHVGQFRRYAFTDLLIRYLEYQAFKVNHVVNITDYDDKTIEGAMAAKTSLGEFTRPHLEDFLADLDRLGIRRAQAYPRVSDHFQEMTDLTRTLVNQNHAYEKLHSVYFDLSRLKGYGRLSKVDVNKIRIGATVDLDEYEKQNPRDFTLLKRVRLSELKQGVGIKTEWGNVRPSLHLQCAAISMAYLGSGFDIHTGSRELMFPHHENEIAIAEALTDKPLAKYWLHSELLLVDGKKMSSENDNVVTLKDLLARGFTGREIRFMLMSVQYRKPINFSIKRLENVRTALKRLDEFTCKLLCLPPGRPHPEVTAYVSAMEEQFFAAMDDDLNVSLAMAAIYNFIKKTNPILQVNHLDRDQKDYILEKLERLNQVLKIFKLKGCPLEPEIDALIQLREKARVEKDWQVADEARSELAERGIDVIDTANGPVWKRVAGIDED